MNDKKAKVLRKLFLEGMTGAQERVSRKYKAVKHIKTTRGGFIVLDCLRKHYQIAKQIYTEATRKDQEKMMLEAHRAIHARDLQRALPPSYEQGAYHGEDIPTEQRATISI